MGFLKHREGQKKILSILEFSYHQLESPLKSCFSYCALFSKDAVMEKDMLIRLWIANDFIVPLDEGQKIEDAAEEYFSILLQRCFFHDVRINRFGVIIKCKMHDLMHAVARKAAGREICISNSVDEEVLKISRHLGYIDHRILSSSNLRKTHIRSYLPSEPRIFRFFSMGQACLEALLTNWICLRVLSLQCCHIRSLPESVGGLLHLRYLDLSLNHVLEVFPKSISKLYNLQTLILCDCHSLRELPKDIEKLVNLRTLDISLCDSLRNMPEGIGKLSYLQVLNKFVIDGSKLSRKQWCDQLGELGKLDNLKDALEVIIKVGDEHSIDVREAGTMGAAYLRGKQHLIYLEITFLDNGYIEGAIRLLEELQPHPNLKGLQLYGYKDPMMRMPEWANNLATSLPNLIYFKFIKCEVKYLSCLGNLLHLEELHLLKLKKLEYINEDMRAVARSNETPTCISHGLPSAQGFVLYPCLQTLYLMKLPMLKGWGNSSVGVGDNTQQQQDTSNTTRLYFPQLESLTIMGCPQLICILLCPNLMELSVQKFNRKMQVVTFDNTIDDERTDASAPSSSSSSSYNISELWKIEIDDVAWLNSFAKETFQCLTKILIVDKEVERLEEAEEVFRSCSSSLQTLEFSGCSKLKRVWSGGLEHLIALQHLSMYNCLNVRLLGEEEREDGISMSRLPHLNSLRTLLLSSHQQLADLENWIPFLPALQSLTVFNCQGLESLPHWMSKLTSLKTLELLNCSEDLKKRCKRTTGQDWPYIHHIHTINFHY